MDGGMMMSDIMFEHLTKTYPNGFISVDDVTLKIQVMNCLMIFCHATESWPWHSRIICFINI